METQQWIERTRAKAVWIFETYVFPYIGERPVAKISAHEILALCRRPEQLGKVETAQWVKQRCSAVFRYAVSTLRADSDPTSVLRGALKTVRAVHHASVTYKRRVGHPAQTRGPRCSTSPGAPLEWPGPWPTIRHSSHHPIHVTGTRRILSEVPRWFFVEIPQHAVALMECAVALPVLDIGNQRVKRIR